VKGGRNVRYVVPQIIRNEDFDKRITFYLRVKEVEEDVKVVLLSGEKSLYKRRERVVKPPEMVRLTLLSKFLEKVGNELTIEVQR
jgi:phosphate uptake regulator